MLRSGAKSWMKTGKAFQAGANSRCNSPELRENSTLEELKDGCGAQRDVLMKCHHGLVNKYQIMESPSVHLMEFYI